MAQSPDEYAESLPCYDNSSALLVSETPEGAARSPKELFGAVKESPSMIPIVPDSAYVSWPMVPDAVESERTTPAPSEYQTLSTLPPSLTTERADKSEQTPELQRKHRRASPSPRMKAQSTQSTEWRQVRTKSKSIVTVVLMMTLMLFAVHCTWVAEAKGSSTNDEQKPPSSRTRSRHKKLQSSPQAESSSSSSSESSIHERSKDSELMPQLARWLAITR